MAPAPIEDIDLSELCDKILEVLRALWTFVSDLCLALWSYVSQAFWAVWTYPPFETFRGDFMVALIALEDYAIAHPFTTTAIAVLAYIFVPAVLSTLKRAFLHCVGFRKLGVLRGIVSFTPTFPWRVVFWLTTGVGFYIYLGSYAANYQSTSFGGNVPRNSTFARFQSQGARGGSGYRAVGGSGSPYWD